MGLLDWFFGKARPNSSEPVEPTPNAGLQSAGNQWKNGDRVLAKWLDNFFYPGRIGTVSGDVCEVFYDDGDVEMVHREHILQPDIQVGSRVQSRVQQGPGFAPGRVAEQKGETILVRYDHGEEEWTSISFVRVERPIANVGGEDPMQSMEQPVKREIDLGDPVEQLTWRQGDRVLARWIDFYWYPSTILGIGSKGTHVLFDNGNQRIIQENSLMPLHVEEGEQVYIRPKNNAEQREYTPATILRVDGEKIDVELETGAVETNIRLSRTRLWRCPVGMKGFPFDEGDRVLACDMDECIYPAEIVSIEEDRVIVQFLDGPEQMLTPELIRRFELRADTRIECRWKGGPNYFPGVLSEVDGDRVHINYDDGDEEWTSVRLIRIPRPAHSE